MRRSTLHSRRRHAVGVGTLLASAIVLAACGSSHSPRVAAVGGKTVTSSTAAAPGGPGDPGADANAQLVRYAQCMRGHGVPGFPDPTNGHLLIKAGPGNAGGMNPNSPAFHTAAEDCKSLQPAAPAAGSAQSGQLQSAGLKFAACMRSHGVPDFRDPSFAGGHIQIQLNGVDPNTPAFQSAQQTCGSLMPGGAP